MGLNPDYYMNKASNTASFYMDLETKLLTQMRVRLNTDMTVPISDWKKARLIEVQRLRKDAISELRKISPSLAKNANDTLLDVYKKSFNKTTSQFQSALKDGFTFPKNGGAIDFNFVPKNLETFVGRVTKGLDGISNSLIGGMENGYKEIIQNVVAMDALGIPRQQALQSAMNSMADKGIPVIKDSLGRKWNATNYTEMLMRTEARDIDFLATKNRMDDYGWNLVQTSQHMNESNLCAPWSNKILAVGSIGKNIPKDVQIDGTWEEATGDGYKHPNCRHTEFVYVPGLTSKDPDLASQDKRVENGRKVQQQRQMERQVRKWKNREAVATTPDIKDKAHTKVRQWQSKTNAFTKENGFKRLYNREKNLIKPESSAIKISPKAKPVTIKPKTIKPKAVISKPEPKAINLLNNFDSKGAQIYFDKIDSVHKITSAQQEAIKSYTGGTSDRVNDALRKGYNTAKMKSVYGNRTADVYKEIKSAIKPNPIEITVQRGIRSIDFLGAKVDKLVGTVFKDKGFTSFSVYQGKGGSAFGDLPYQMRVNVPKGYPSRGLANASQFRHEWELLLDEGAEFIVKGISKGDYTTVIDLDILPK